jgi:hypothetical protein
MDLEPVDHLPPPPSLVAKADPDPIAVEFLDAVLPEHVRAFFAELSFQPRGDASVA